MVLSEQFACTPASQVFACNAVLLYPIVRCRIRNRFRQGKVRPQPRRWWKYLMTRPFKVNCGLLQQPLLGAFGFNSSKAGGGGTQPGRCIAYMFAMRVEEELPVWPEKAQRNRLWVSSIASPVSCGNLPCSKAYSQQTTKLASSVKQRLGSCLFCF